MIYSPLHIAEPAEEHVRIGDAGRMPREAIDRTEGDDGRFLLHQLQFQHVHAAWPGGATHVRHNLPVADLGRDGHESLPSQECKDAPARYRGVRVPRVREG